MPKKGDPIKRSDLRGKLVTSDLQTHLSINSKKWEATIADGGQEDPEKIRALKRTMLLIGSGAVSISGVGNVGGVATNGDAMSTSASQNRLPVSELISGRMGRVYISLPKGAGQDVLEWIAGKSETAPGVITPRFTSTHHGTVKPDGSVFESKSNPVWSFIDGLATTLSPVRWWRGDYRVHSGLNIAAGGEGKTYQAADEGGQTIKSDGSGGHILYNTNTSKNGDSIGIGMELADFGRTSDLGTHSLLGHGDEFSAFEGEKFYVKFSPKVPEFKRCVKEGKDDDEKKQIAEAIKKLEKHCKAPEKPSFFKRAAMLLTGKDPSEYKHPNRLSDEEFKECCATADIVFAPGKPPQVLTAFGKKAVEAGIIPNTNYNGATIDLCGSSPEKIAANKNIIQGLKGTDVDALPMEIVYFKPQTSLGAFTAQKPIYEDIASKPVLRDNPQFSHETSVAVGTLYNTAKDSPELATAINQTLGLMSKDNLKTLGFDINTFDARRDIEGLKKSLAEASPERLEKLGVTDRDVVTATLDVAKELADKAATRFDSPEGYTKLQADATKDISTAISKSSGIDVPSVEVPRTVGEPVVEEPMRSSSPENLTANVLQISAYNEASTLGVVAAELISAKTKISEKGEEVVSTKVVASVVIEASEHHKIVAPETASQVPVGDPAPSGVGMSDEDKAHAEVRDVMHSVGTMFKSALRGAENDAAAVVRRGAVQGAVKNIENHDRDGRA